MKAHEIISRIDSYAEATGLSRSTICERATGNSRLYERLERRINSEKEIAKRFSDFFAANPVNSETSQ